MHRSLEIIVSFSEYLSFQIWAVQYFFKSHLLISLSSLEKSLSIGRLSGLHWADTSFPKFQVLLESSNFIFGRKECLSFSLKWQALFMHSQEKVCQKTSSHNNSLLSAVFQGKMVVHEKIGYFSLQLKRLHTRWSIAVEVLYAYFLFYHIEYWKDIWSRVKIN